VPGDMNAYTTEAQLSDSDNRLSNKSDKNPQHDYKSTRQVVL
jgi:hypothetical protein